MKNKAFGLWSAVFLGIGAMVGAGIFIVIGLAGSIAGNLVWLSFVISGVAAAFSGYSLAKLAVAYPSRGGIVEYIVQEWGENRFSGTMSVIFYFAQIIALAAVAKSFGEYGSRLFGFDSVFMVNLFSVGIVVIFTVINLVGATWVARSENVIVIVKLVILAAFTVVALMYIHPEYLSLKDSPKLSAVLFATGLTFFAFQGYSVITNTVEDMQEPEKNMLKAILFAIFIVMVLYVAVSVAVLGNLTLEEVIKAKDYALAEAAKPVFGETGFKVMAVAALIATASAINATLYAAAEIGYTLAKKGELPEIYEYNVFNSSEGLIISAALVIALVLGFSLGSITTVAALSVLIIQAVVHLGHLKLVNYTNAKKILVVFAFAGMMVIVAFTLYYNYKTNKSVVFYLIATFAAAFLLEMLLKKYFDKSIKSGIKD